MSSLVISGDTSGTVTVTVPAVAGTNTVTIPASTGTVMVSGNMPAFSAYQSSAQTLTLNVNTKLQFQTKEFDTANCYDNVTNYRFTPNVAGYYQVSAGFRVSAVRANLALSIFKNGSEFKDIGTDSTPSSAQINGSALVYMNGSTDYIEAYGLSGASQALLATNYGTFFQATMIRSA